MKDYRSEFPVGKMAEVLDVSRSGFYSWLKRPVSTRKKNIMRFDAEVKAHIEESKGTYGSVRLNKELLKHGYGRNRKRVADSMVRQGLRSKVCKMNCTRIGGHTYYQNIFIHGGCVHVQENKKEI